jgi:hypothetical protein
MSEPDVAKTSRQIVLELARIRFPTECGYLSGSKVLKTPEVHEKDDQAPWSSSLSSDGKPHLELDRFLAELYLLVLMGQGVQGHAEAVRHQAEADRMTLPSWVEFTCLVGKCCTLAGKNTLLAGLAIADSCKSQEVRDAICENNPGLKGADHDQMLGYGIRVMPWLFPCLQKLSVPCQRLLIRVFSAPVATLPQLVQAECCAADIANLIAFSEAELYLWITMSLFDVAGAGGTKLKIMNQKTWENFRVTVDVILRHYQKHVHEFKPDFEFWGLRVYTDILKKRAALLNPEWNVIIPDHWVLCRLACMLRLSVSECRELENRINRVLLDRNYVDLKQGLLRTGCRGDVGFLPVYGPALLNNAWRTSKQLDLAIKHLSTVFSVLLHRYQDRATGLSTVRCDLRLMALAFKDEDGKTMFYRREGEALESPRPLDVRETPSGTLQFNLYGLDWDAV